MRSVSLRTLVRQGHRPRHGARSPSPGYVVRPAAWAFLGIASLPGHAIAAAKLTTLYTFQGGSDGGNPVTETLLPGPDGSLFGSTRDGASGTSAVFQLSPPANGGTPWTYTLLQSFTALDERPTGLLAGPGGSLYGETIHGGQTANCSVGCGQVFQLSPPSKGQTVWTETILYAFSGGTDGAYPRDGLVPDGDGNLFGTNVQSAACGDGCGTVFELSPPAQGQAVWTLSTLYTFTGTKTGLYPGGKLLPDQSGGFYGITWGGANTGGSCWDATYLGCGTVYHLTPPTKVGGAWKHTTLYAFTGGADGQTPYSLLTLDSAGDILSLTQNGGQDARTCLFTPGGCGTVFSLAPPQGGNGAWTLSTPWQFTGKRDGNQPMAAGLSPFKGKYITTTAGDAAGHDFGTIDMFVPGAQGQPWTERTLFKFTNDANGAMPLSYVLERDGVFFGMTRGVSGSTQYGTVFSLKP